MRPARKASGVLVAFLAVGMLASACQSTPVATDGADTSASADAVTGAGGLVDHRG